jgi:hypothetical protein
MPSLTAYSCPQFPQASFPLAMLVSSSSVWRSWRVCEGAVVATSAVSAASVAGDADGISRESGSGTVEGRGGRPS